MGRNYSATAVDTTLATAITATATNISVVATVGLPTAPFLMAIIDSPGSQEIVNVTGVSGTTLTIVRGYDGTVATPHASGTLIRHVFSAIDAREMSLHIDATTGVHGVGAGAVVGTTTTQTLTNKNLTSGTNTFPSYITGFLVPTGAEMMWPSTAPAPAGYLLENGSEQPIATYTALYNFLTNNGSSFPFGANTNGSGAAGSTHFRLPNPAGLVVVGYNASDSDFNAIGKTGGAKTHTLSLAELPVHTHSIAHDHAAFTSGVDSPDHSHEYVRENFTPVGVTPGGSGLLAASGSSYFPQTGGASARHAHTIDVPSFTGNSGSVGSGAAHNNLQPYTVRNFIIKT